MYQLADATQEQRQEALSRIANNPNYHPVSALIPITAALELEKVLEPLAAFSIQSRVTISRIIEWHRGEDCWRKSKNTMLMELGITAGHLQYVEGKWPGMYMTINLLMRLDAQNKVGKVYGSMADAAVLGDSRDRRLYLEWIGELKREDPAAAQKGITFVQNVFNRPPAADVKVLEADVIKQGADDD